MERSRSLGMDFFYSSIALVAFFFAFNKSYLPATIGLLICSIVCAGSLVPSFIEWINSGMPSIVSEMKAESPHIEYVREFLGLILSIIVILVYYFLQKKQASSIS